MIITQSESAKFFLWPLTVTAVSNMRRQVTSDKEFILAGILTTNLQPKIPPFSLNTKSYLDLVKDDGTLLEISIVPFWQ